MEIWSRTQFFVAPLQLNWVISMLFFGGLSFVLVVGSAVAGIWALEGGQDAFRAVMSSFWATIEWWRALYVHLGGATLAEGEEIGLFSSVPYAIAQAPDGEPCVSAEEFGLRSRVHTHSLALVSHIWRRPHYRNGDFADDLRKNLRNVALPGTGIPLSVFAWSRTLFMSAAAVCGPPAALISGLWLARGASKSWSEYLRRACARYVSELCAPSTWFALWQLNCRLATLHSWKTRDPGFRLEDKLAFLEDAAAVNVPVSPWFSVDGVVAKNRNEEGGLGFASFASATHGGAWIVQPTLENHASVQSLLPKGAPLSTLRIVTASLGGLRTESDARSALAAEVASTGSVTRSRGSPSIPSADSRSDGVSMEEDKTKPVPMASSPEQPQDDDEEEEDEETVPVKALSCVWRAGRAGAATDHSSILFDIDMETGTIKYGGDNSHWYKLGLSAVGQTPLDVPRTATAHPDTQKELFGSVLPRIADARRLCEDAHRLLAPNVPLIGWDVAFTQPPKTSMLGSMQSGAPDSSWSSSKSATTTPKIETHTLLESAPHPSLPHLCILEANFSCNFFRGTMDEGWYYRFVQAYMNDLETA